MFGPTSASQALIIYHVLFLFDIVSSVLAVACHEYGADVFMQHVFPGIRSGVSGVQGTLTDI